jgi:hypothetical protein
MTPTWTAHNIYLDHENATIDRSQPSIADDPIFLATKILLEILYPDVKKRGDIKIADLACLEGGYSVEFARMGFNVTGIEIRENNLDACNYTLNKLKLRNLKFVRDDVRNIVNHGVFDVIFCCGIYYHLDNPRQFMNTLSEATKKLLVLNTHFSTELQNQRFKLTEITSHEGIPGRWFHEFETSKIEEREIHRWAAWNNDNSFWQMKNHLIQSLKDSGFDFVSEQFGMTNIETGITSGGLPIYDRGQFIGIKQ